jgi:hypothetical protein
MTHAELLSRMDAREIMEWQAYFRIDNERQEEERRRAMLESAAVAGLNKPRRT